MFPFIRDDVLPSWWANAIQQYIAGLVGNVRVRQASATVVEVSGGVGEDAVVLAIDGRWRWIEASEQIAHPGGPAGEYVLWATAEDNDIDAVPLPGTDNTDYSFNLQITNGSDPIGVLWRAVARIAWSGAAITGVAPLIGPEVDSLRVGTIVEYGGSADPGGAWLLCDGRALSRTAHAELFAVLQDTYGAGDGASTFNIPDYRGRTGYMPRGAKAIAQTVADIVRGVAGGEREHTLTPAETAVRSHTHRILGNTANGGANHNHSMFDNILRYISGGGWFGSGGGPHGADTVNDDTGHTNPQHAHGIDFQSQGLVESNGAAHNNVPPYLGVNRIIRVI